MSESIVKSNLLGILVSCVDYDKVVAEVIHHAADRKSFTVSAMAVHGIMTGFFDVEHRYRLNKLDMIVPDGQPVRWALNWIYHSGLKDRVYGPELMLRLCGAAEASSLSVFLFGSSREVLAALEANLKARFPCLKVAGTRPSLFRKISIEERIEIVQEVEKSGASIVFVGLGCPRQEVWAYEMRDLISLPLIAVGAAFDFHAGLLKQAPSGMQRWGLEWLFRLMMEPRRLWRRYLYLNPAYLLLVFMQKLGIIQFSDAGRQPERERLYG